MLVPVWLSPQQPEAAEVVVAEVTGIVMLPILPVSQITGILKAVLQTNKAEMRTVLK